MPAKPSARPTDEWSGKVAETAIRLGVLAVVLALGYKLFQAWLVTGPAVNKPADAV